jgi:hypothetical protein
VARLSLKHPDYSWAVATTWSCDGGVGSGSLESQRVDAFVSQNVSYDSGDGSGELGIRETNFQPILLCDIVRGLL